MQIWWGVTIIWMCLAMMCQTGGGETSNVWEADAGNFTGGPCKLPSSAHSFFTVEPSKAEYTAGENIHLQCASEKYTFHGSKTLVCMINGKWSILETPICLDEACPVLHSPVDGDVDFVMGEHGAGATFSCRKGFYLQPAKSKHLICSEHGWSDVAPVCIPLCPEVDHPKNGLFRFSCRHVTCKASVLCDEGFQPYPGSEYACEESSEWAPPVTSLSCIRNGSLGSILGGIDPIEDSVLEENSTSSALTTGPPTSEADQTTESVHSHCPIPKEFPYGKVHFHQGHLTYECQYMYILVGQASQTCRRSGNWSGEIPKCFHVSDASVDLSRQEVMRYWVEIFRLYPYWVGDYVIVNITMPTSLSVQHFGGHFINYLLDDGIAQVRLRAERAADRLMFSVIHVDMASEVFVPNTNWSFRAVLKKRASNWTIEADWFSNVIDGFKEFQLHVGPRKGGIHQASKETPHHTYQGQAGFAKAMALGVFFGGLAIVLAGLGAYLMVRRYGAQHGDQMPRVAGFENPVYNQQIT